MAPKGKIHKWHAQKFIILRFNWCQWSPINLNCGRPIWSTLALIWINFDIPYWSLYGRTQFFLIKSNLIKYVFSPTINQIICLSHFMLLIILLLICHYLENTNVFRTFTAIILPSHWSAKFWANVIPGDIIIQQIIPSTFIWSIWKLFNNLWNLIQLISRFTWQAHWIFKSAKFETSREGQLSSKQRAPIASFSTN